MEPNINSISFDRSSAPLFTTVWMITRSDTTVWMTARTVRTVTRTVLSCFLTRASMGKSNYYDKN